MQWPNSTIHSTSVYPCRGYAAGAPTSYEIDHARIFSCYEGIKYQAIYSNLYK